MPSQLCTLQVLWQKSGDIAAAALEGLPSNGFQGRTLVVRVLLHFVLDVSFVLH